MLRSLHVGLNHVDAAAYQDWDGRLEGCEADAGAMARLAADAGFFAKTLMTEDATAGALRSEVEAAAAALTAGDLFFLTFAGHGGSIPASAGHGDEGDHRDETWVLFDRQVLDDEVYEMLSHFAEGVHVLVASDSCHAAGILLLLPVLGPPDTAVRSMPDALCSVDYRSRAALYDDVRSSTPRAGELDVQAAVILLAACREDQSARERDGHGLFSLAFEACWAAGAFQGSHVGFLEAIRAWLADQVADQRPEIATVGVADDAFLNARPLTALATLT